MPPAVLPRTRRIALPALGAVVLMCVTGCGHDERSITGPVSTVGPHLCIAAPDARGVCLAIGKADVSGVHLDDCVTVHYTVPRPMKADSDGDVTRITSAAGCPDIRPLEPTG